MQDVLAREAHTRVRVCLLTLHDGVYFATREMGTLVETERYLHNYALSYALFNDSLIRSAYYAASHRPTYANDLALLTDAGVYVTPARPLAIQYQLVTYKVAQTTYHQRAQRFEPPNYPRNIGRVKELAPGSTFECFIFGGDQVDIPRWIRLGKWMSKAELQVVEDQHVTRHEGEYRCRHALNPLDIGPGELGVFNLVSMPPVSLIVSAHLRGFYVTVQSPQGETQLPWGMRYTFPEDVLNTQTAAPRRPRGSRS